MNSTIRLVAVGALVLTACSGTDSAGAIGAADDGSWENLFEAPSTAAKSSDTLLGLWAGSDTVGSADADVRMKIESDRVTFATKCRFKDGAILTVGAAVGARTSADKVVILESKNAESRRGELFCRMKLAPRTLIFDIHDGGALVRADSPPGSFTLTKLSDL